MNFLANENFPLTSIKVLRSAGYYVVSVIEEMSGVTDLEVLKRAQAEKHIILTFDHDYGDLIYKYRLYVPDGVVYFRFDPFTPDEPAKILLDVLKSGKILLSGKFTVIERNRVRQRSILNDGQIHLRQV